jgi:uncharacterized protein (TIGR03790 family)
MQKGSTAFWQAVPMDLQKRRRMRFHAKTRIALLALALVSGARAGGLAGRIVIVANSLAPDSVAVAEHYAHARGVPEANVIALAMPVGETVSWREFVATVWQPLEDELVRRGWIDAIPMDLFDEVGRRKYAISGHRIAALVLCRGVPLKIRNDPALFAEVRPLTDHEQLRTNEGAVDSELSLLAQSDYPINALIPNPLFNNPRPTDIDRSRVIKVSRLDGPTAAEAMGLVDRAIEAEETGFLGRAYVDVAGPSASGDHMLETAAAKIRGLGFDLDVSHGPETLAATARFDAPALYFGWYTANLNGPFGNPGFLFPPGAIAVHIHSYSAGTLRSETEGWCGPLVARGVTATLGNVFEPYLEYSHHPDLFVEALARGDNLVDAAYYALPVLSWQSIVIGDPLYRPFAVPLAAQLANLSKLPPQLAGYAVVRGMIALDAAGKGGEAIDSGKAGMKDAPNLALALALAERLRASGNNDQAVWVIKEAAEAAGTSTDQWALIRAAALFLAENRRSDEAIDVYQKLFSIDAIPPAVRAPWLTEARQVALASGDASQAAEWNDDLQAIVGKSPGARP